MITRLWGNLLSALSPKFGADQHGQAAESTFRLLAHLLKVLVALIAIWAVAAGFLQTGRLIKYIPKGFPGDAKGFWAGQANWLGPLFGAPVYALESFGVVMLIGLAAALIGGFLGFLFGLPRIAGEIHWQAAASATPAPGPLMRAGAAADASAASSGASTALGQPDGVRAGMPPGRRGWQSSTNLTEISDWLTKIIVGVGLVEAKAIYDRLSQLSGSLGGMLFDGAAGSRLIIPAVIIAGALLGFLYAYLFTQLRVAQLVAHTDVELGNVGAALQPLPPGVQDRKQAFSDYIQSLVAEQNRDVLDRIAEALGLERGGDLTTQRDNILDAVTREVDLPDPAAAAATMDDVSSKLRPITNRGF